VCDRRSSSGMLNPMADHLEAPRHD
jgi:hypothetical protein